MWKIECEGCGTTVLLGMRRVLRVRNDGHGIAVDLECHCGTIHAVRTGQQAPTAA
jgi:hypothetical protein